ncbi:MAG: 4Fe-4S dicluster domain-containing protein [Syntrophorhabdales bacterium]|jgi:Fe-S-cluster-containing dehydrogenase component
MKGWYFVIDVEKCEDCKNCFLSCKDEFVGNDWPAYSAPMPDHGQSWIVTEGKERGQYPFIDVAYLPSLCMHCDNPPCLTAAAGGAIYKRRDGIVLIDPLKAKGQQDLVKACPYGAIRWNEALKLPQKCTFCAHLLDSGWEQTRCVQSCPTSALNVRKAEKNEMEEITRVESLEVYHPGFATHPRVFYKNLYRYTRCFVGGSVALHINGQEECAAGAHVALFDFVGERIAEQVTNNYGDYKFDNLAEGSGTCTILIEMEGYETETRQVDLAASLTMETVHLESSKPA